MPIKRDKKKSGKVIRTKEKTEVAVYQKFAVYQTRIFSIFEKTLLGTLFHLGFSHKIGPLNSSIITFKHYRFMSFYKIIFKKTPVFTVNSRFSKPEKSATQNFH